MGMLQSLVLLPDCSERKQNQNIWVERNQIIQNYPENYLPCEYPNVELSQKKKSIVELQLFIQLVPGHDHIS